MGPGSRPASQQREPAAPCSSLSLGSCSCFTTRRISVSFGRVPALLVLLTVWNLLGLLVLTITHRGSSGCFFFSSFTYLFIEGNISPAVKPGLQLPWKELAEGSQCRGKGKL